MVMSVAERSCQHGEARLSGGEVGPLAQKKTKKPRDGQPQSFCHVTPGHLHENPFSDTAGDGLEPGRHPPQNNGKTAADGASPAITCDDMMPAQFAVI